MTESILYWAVLWGSIYNVDPSLVLSVIQVESDYKADAIGAHGEVGLMQLRPKFFGKKKDLLNPEINIKLGVEHLAKMKIQCKHKVDRLYVVCFNAGVNNGSKIKKPRDFQYYKKIMKAYHRIKQEAPCLKSCRIR